MNKRQAHTLLRLQRVVNRAVDSALRAYPPNSPDRLNAEAYWAGHLKSIVNGQGYGSCPIMQAEDKIIGESYG